MDEINLKIIKILQEKARIPNVDVARIIDMAPSAVLERIRKLEKQGYIDGYEVRLNPEKFNRKMIAFITVNEKGESMNNQLGDALSNIPGVQEVHYVSGNDSYLVKIRVSGHEEVRRIVRENIQSQPGVHSTQTSIVLESYKETSSIVIDGED